jgi:hypothetical protein
VPANARGASRSAGHGRRRRRGRPRGRRPGRRAERDEGAPLRTPWALVPPPRQLHHRARHRISARGRSSVAAAVMASIMLAVVVGIARRGRSSDASPHSPTPGRRRKTGRRLHDRRAWRGWGTADPLVSLVAAFSDALHRPSAPPQSRAQQPVRPCGRVGRQV